MGTGFANLAFSLLAVTVAVPFKAFIFVGDTGAGVIFPDAGTTFISGTELAFSLVSVAAAFSLNYIQKSMINDSLKLSVPNFYGCMNHFFDNFIK